MHRMGVITCSPAQKHAPCIGTSAPCAICLYLSHTAWIAALAPLIPAHVLQELASVC